MSRISRYLTPLYWFTSVIILGASLYALIGLLLNSLLPSNPAVANELQQACGALIAMLCCLASLFFPLHTRLLPPHRLPTTRAIQRRGPLLLALVFLPAFISHIAETLCLLHYILESEAWGEILFLWQYPFLLGVILCLPTRPLSRIMSLRTILDSVLIVTVVLTFSWYFLLGPVVLYGPQPVSDKALITISVCGDLILLFSFLILTSSSSDPDVQPAQYILVLGIALLLIGDGLGGYSIVRSSSIDGYPQDPLWVTAYILFLMSAYYMRFSAQSPSAQSQRAPDSSTDPLTDPPPFWHTILPSALVPAVIVLVTYVWLVGHNDPLTQGVYIAGAILLAQVVLRQVFSLQETHFYTQKLRSIQQELQKKNQTLAGANQQLAVQAKQIEHAYEQQIQLNELKDQFLLNVSHELRTPLTMLGVSLDLLKGGNDGQLDPTEHADILELAITGQEELTDLVNRVLDTTKIVSELPQAKCEAVRMHQIVQEELTALAPLQSYTICLHIPKETTAWADPQLLRQILRNLLSNILKYVPKQTEIHIETVQSTPSSPVSLIVQDAGPGIPPAEIPLLFEKFVRLKRDLAGPTRGTGLGLYICKQLVEAMGGRIWIESSGRTGEGTRFHLTLLPPENRRLTQLNETPSSNRFDTMPISSASS